jgi:hypothetical protein
MKNETEQKRGHLVRKMTLEKKETANDAHRGCVTKKGIKRQREVKKSRYAADTHTAYASHCAVRSAHALLASRSCLEAKATGSSGWTPTRALLSPGSSFG